MSNTPWYMRSTDTTDKECGSESRQYRFIKSIAEGASEEDDAMVAHLEAAEERGVELNPATRMAMGYATNARKAADKLSTMVDPGH